LHQAERVRAPDRPRLPPPVSPRPGGRMVRLTAVRSLARLLLAALPPLAAPPLLAPATAAQTMKLVNPATSGIPGDDVRLVSFAPDGMLWVGARWIFWGYGGFGWLASPGAEAQSCPRC